MSTTAIAYSSENGNSTWSGSVSALDFTLTSPITVTDLGAFIDQASVANGTLWVNPKYVYIYNASTMAVVASATIAPGTAKDSGSQACFAHLSTGVTLSSGVTYRLVAGNYASPDPLYTGAGGTSSAPPSYVTLSFPSGTTFNYTQTYNSGSYSAYPSNGLGSASFQWLGATFKYTASASLTVSPTSGSVADNSTTLSITPTLTGSSASLSASVSGGGAISTTTPTSGTAFTYTPPTIGSGTATVTVTDSADNLTATCTITYGPKTLTVSPTSGTVVDASTTLSITPTLTGSSASLTASVSGGGTISTTSPTSGTPFTYTPPSTGSGTATVTVTDSSDSLTATCSIAYSATSVSFTGFLTCASNTHRGGIVFTFSEAAGGTAPYTYKLYRSSSPLYSASNGTLVATLGPTSASSGLSLTDTSPPSVYTYYLATVTDNGGNVATCTQIALGGGQIYYGIQPCKYDVNITAIGDSITYGVGVTSSTTYIYLAVQALGTIFPDMSFTLNNVAVSGSTTADWLAGTNGVSGTNCAAAVSAYNASADENICTVMLGANDARDDHQFTPATYASNLTMIANILKTTGYKVMLFGPGFIVQNNASWTNANVLSNLVAYGQQILTIADNATIFAGINFLEGDSVYDQNQTGDGIGDGTHPDSVIQARNSYPAAAALTRMIDQVRSLYGLSTTGSSSGSGTGLTLAQLQSTLAAGVVLASNGLDNVTVETGLNARQALSVGTAALAGVLSGAGSGTIIIKGAGTTTTRITATTDNAGNRTSVSLNIPN